MSKKIKPRLGNRDVSTKALRTMLSNQLSEEFNQTIEVTEQDIIDALKLSEGSKAAAKFVVPYAKVLSKAMGLKVRDSIKEDASTKVLKRIFSKAISQYNKVVSDVPDIGRMRLLVETPEDIKTLREMMLGSSPEYTSDKLGGTKRVGKVLDRNPTNEITIKEFEDFYREPSSTGRIGIHITLLVKTPGNLIVPFEIQVMHKDMVATEDFTRNNYMNAQSIRRAAKAEFRDLTDQEQEAIEAYDASSRERYTADALKYDLFDLRRSALCSPAQRRQALKLVAA